MRVRRGRGPPRADGRDRRDPSATIATPPCEEDLVRRTVSFLLQHQEIADFPDLVELEDVVASYDDYLDAVRSASP